MPPSKSPDQVQWTERIAQRQSRLEAIRWKHRLMSMTLLAFCLPLSLRMIGLDTSLLRPIAIDLTEPYLVLGLGILAIAGFILWRARS
jgi:hypothetical protein